MSPAESCPRRDLNPRYRRERASDEVRLDLLNLARASNHASLKGFYHCLTLARFFMPCTTDALLGKVSKESVGKAAASGFGNLGEAELAPPVVAGGTEH